MADTAVLDKTAAVSRDRKGKRLTQAEVGLLLKLRQDGFTQDEIAQRLGVSQKAVWNWLQDLTDTTESAKSYLRGQALRMAQKVVKHGKPDVQLKALQGVGVANDGEQKAGLVIQIGIKDSDVTVHLSPPNHQQLAGDSTG